jgi:hypothetical protein
LIILTDIYENYFYLQIELVRDSDKFFGFEHFKLANEANKDEIDFNNKTSSSIRKAIY